MVANGDSTDGSSRNAAVGSPDTVILGGGIAGLAAAIASDAPLYEAAPEVGGVAASKKVDGFFFDYGIHVLQTNHQRVHGIFNDAGVKLGTRQRNAHIFSNRTFTAYPFQINTAGLPLALRLKCLWNYFRRDTKAEPKNYEQWIRSNMGSGFGDEFLIPYSEKFWTVHPREMTYEWTGNRVPTAKAWQVLRGALVNRQTKIGTNATFQYPDDGEGFGSITTRMGAQINKLHLRHRATLIDVHQRRIEFNNGAAECGYESLIATLPLPELIRLMPAAPQHVRDAVAKLRWNSIIVVNLGIDDPDLSDKHWVHFPEKEFSLFRMSFPHNLGPGMVPAGMSSIAAEVSYSDWKPIDKSSVVDRVIDDLQRAKILRPDHRIVVRDTMDIKYGYVLYDQNRAAVVKVIHEWLKSVNVHPAGRYALWAYLWSHESLLSGLQTANRVLKKSEAEA